MNSPVQDAAPRAAPGPSRAAVAPGLRLRRALLASRGTKPVVFVLAATPFVVLAWRALHSELGANPAQQVIWTTGLWALRMLMITLAVTPLRVITGWVELARLRRMLGLFAFGYALLHFTSYLGLVNGFSLTEVLQDVVRHPFVLAGMSALLLMLPLALTSTNAMVRRLGGARWRALHKLVYAIGIIAVFHYWWGKLAKNNTADPKLYALLLALLLGWRVVQALRARARRA
ncbi:MAG: sulfoxide reductase heme-binding subunit YedZ [Betaproteobacteria bacterium]|jgi:methionine sulfoxide reductase heme-binding subunit|uniref:sulfite oxidase heme-binding subunit YedZ n=1 Tax=Thiomonas sp. FB-6 TaxID=1158291 RepID=UPI0009DBFC47|nr:protein-methionine-sulfoxide reductase heme-binding subunit MsrQ [Thiomonas sp. FB-6]MBU6439814.1 sulfoxide reductase heme-binding subunit YedZ [Betaproteobacteria bacterium]MBU6513974.1 sulfoxide reductase heme-binding subunit YedZ [Betaproteobacteria bacterium]MDE1956638.1 sulfoxide reductase heme-binding subunit YedZ [Betaproteobacteria bacterium]MDE2153921.1 sulfoxide reductase heme-binding subunit YedZ [Betaproteobacteria bacterium]